MEFRQVAQLAIDTPVECVTRAIRDCNAADVVKRRRKKNALDIKSGPSMHCLRIVARATSFFSLASNKGLIRRVFST